MFVCFLGWAHTFTILKDWFGLRVIVVRGILVAPRLCLRLVFLLLKLLVHLLLPGLGGKVRVALPLGGGQRLFGAFRRALVSDGLKFFWRQIGSGQLWIQGWRQVAIGFLVYKKKVCISSLEHHSSLAVLHDKFHLDSTYINTSFTVIWMRVANGNGSSANLEGTLQQEHTQGFNMSH